MAVARIDVWLSAARLFKSRTAARDACVGGSVKVNGLSVKPSQEVKAGDEVRAMAPRGVFIGKILDVADKRLSAPLARLLYEDLSPPPVPREERVAPRERGAGRPTKADRRALGRLTGEDDED
jgi:ribosome-associated heat shock protein Hsp15